MIHTCIVSYNRLDLLQKTVASYLETVSIPWTAIIVDNGSDEETHEWLQEHSPIPVLFLGHNYYPGYAANRGFELAPPEAQFLHRSDNDMLYLRDWCQTVLEAFEDEHVGQVGLRTEEEEEFNWINVGGNSVIRRSLWDAGLRYDERPWSPHYHTEDAFVSKDVLGLGYQWRRVPRACIVNMQSGDLSDPYYIESFGARGITFETEET